MLLLVVGVHSLDSLVAEEVDGVGWDASHRHGLYAAPEMFDSCITAVIVVRLGNVADVNFFH